MRRRLHLVKGDSRNGQEHSRASTSSERKGRHKTESLHTSRPFPAGQKFTREMFDAWIDVIYPLALRGAFSAQPKTFAGAEVPWTSNAASDRDRHRFSGHVNNAWAEAKHDALARAMELVYEAPVPENPILGREYTSVEHLGHRFRKVANGCVRSQHRAEAPSIVTSAKGITSKIEAAIPDFAEAESQTARFKAKYLAYEIARCPVCAGEVPLKTRRCVACGVAIPQGAEIELTSDTGYQRLWERAAAPVLRTAAAEGRLFEMLTKDRPDELTLADEHPYAAMMPLRIAAPWTSAMEAAWRAGAAAVRQRIADKYDMGPSNDRLVSVHTSAVMYGEDDGSYSASVALAMGLGPDDTYAAAPPSKVWRKRSPVDRGPEPAAIESLGFRIRRWRRAVESEAHRVRFVNDLLAKGEIPNGMRRRRPNRALPDWPTPPLPATKIPAATQDYRTQTMRIGRELIALLKTVLAQSERAAEIPALGMPALESDAFRAAAVAGKRWLRDPLPDPASPYDARRRVEHLAALTYAFLNAAYWLDLEAFIGEVRSRYAYTW